MYLSPIELLLTHPNNNLSESQALNKLLNFGIYRKSDIFAPLSSLSIGARRKAQLAQIFSLGFQVLLLDEPTNHMDLFSLDQIEENLLEFPGIIIAVSHDKFFTKKIATQTLRIKGM